MVIFLSLPGQGGTQVAGGAGGIYGGYSQGSPGDLVQGGESETKAISYTHCLLSHHETVAIK